MTQLLAQSDPLFRFLDIAIVTVGFVVAAVGLYWVCTKFFEGNKYVLAFCGALLIICIVIALAYFVQHDYSFHIIHAGG